MADTRTNGLNNSFIKVISLRYIKMAPKVRKSKTPAWKKKGMNKRRYAKRVLVNRAIQPVAQRYIAKHKYVANVVTDANGNYVFNLNSTFDPDRTGGGASGLRKRPARPVI